MRGRPSAMIFSQSSRGLRRTETRPRASRGHPCLRRLPSNTAAISWSRGSTERCNGTPFRWIPGASENVCSACPPRQSISITAASHGSVVPSALPVEKNDSPANILFFSLFSFLGRGLLISWSMLLSSISSCRTHKLQHTRAHHARQRETHLTCLLPIVGSGPSFNLPPAWPAATRESL